MEISPCPHCGGKTLFKSRAIGAGGGHAPNYLPDLGRLFSAAKFHLIVCRDCWLTRFFAQREALEELPESTRWERV
jgi:hypothetical protein